VYDEILHHKILAYSTKCRPSGFFSVFQQFGIFGASKAIFIHKNEFSKLLKNSKNRFGENFNKTIFVLMSTTSGILKNVSC